MATYELRFKASVAKDLRGVPKPDTQRILARIELLRENPRPQGSEKLSGEEKYRIRQGDYRILYSIDEQTVVVEVVRIGHRREVYR
ncbi:MAG: type II toxin-antitoxin system RelE/ParE family toxin [Gammaproteobacteria bacterium]|jgi:mRNA interferase RelE/StbE|uniref:type II toxin-antitoxin system RelE family toxin n=1 Tax=Nevskia sp. TaxID=1929292 RepID=UPI0040361A91|nr:type II toxin-antitoxin system RelE/ParE family toxin [Gammaproteobacteria bacterium]